MPEDQTIRPAGPGKFSTLVDLSVWNFAQDGVDAEVADESFGWKGCLYLDPGSRSDISKVKDCDLNEAEWTFLASQVGCILTQAEDGLVTIHYFEDPAALLAEWGKVEEEYAEVSGAEAEDPMEAENG